MVSVDSGESFLDRQKDWRMAEGIPRPADTPPNWLTKIPLVLIGCITYSGSTLTDIHQTGFMLDFAEGFGSDSLPKSALIDVSGDEVKEYDISAISLIQGYRGGFIN
jgi:hypothetical protein